MAESDTESDTGETTRIVDPVTTEYLDGLRSALADLPSAELAEIVEDARGHLADLASELGQDYDRAAVHARLGTPAAYAAELRAAAGFPAPPPAEPRPRWSARFAVFALVVATLFAAVGGMIGIPMGYLALTVGLVAAAVGILPVLSDGPLLRSVGVLRPVRALAVLRTPGPAPAGNPNWRDPATVLAALQPGWWVLRAVLAAGAVAALATRDGTFALLITVLVALAAIPLSFVLGARTRADRRLLWLVVPLNAFAAGLVVAAAGALTDDEAQNTQPVYQNGLVQDGEIVSDVRPFDAQGRPLSGVYLFDQDGTPLSVHDYVCSTDRGPVADGTDTRPYPRGTTEVDPDTGRCVTTPPAPLVVTVPGTTPAPAAGEGPPPTATVAPSPAPPSPPPPPGN
ncbi:HAAS signaling domain-containing protein [Pseudonocardia sp. HH130630-07]|uniref:HAAS signaling domain-containing protein n=1 Tax=Pseudonocardia sp. HH130630-07 TaxID=1690815 RepID=UPI00081532FC|nr:hypothetical protein [Pseudonocardia sp. HH130630-07]ANY08216.1 hypothetical protein AFB00_20220 [Pseudonocardia sp. HH130630-07]